MVNPVRTIALILAMSLLAPVSLADQRDVDSDPAVDFSIYKTYKILDGQLVAKAPELNNPLARNEIETGLRTALAAQGLQEASTLPDLLLSWRFGAADPIEQQAYVSSHWGLGRVATVTEFSEGTLLVQFYSRTSGELLWRGIYRDEARDAAQISSNMERNIGRLFKDFPPKSRRN
jgi:hypothetical protein